MFSSPFVSVFCPTYNHEKYIRQCLEGIVMQETSFQIEVIVQDDASTDGTTAIIKEFAKRYAFIIPIIHEVNIYSLGRNLNEYWLKNARGKYMAFCEGDDYWTDPLKLQKQVDFLEANLDYSFCGHSVEIFNQYEKVVAGQYSPKKNILELCDTVFGPPMHTSSIVFRNNFKLPKSIKYLPAGDDALECILASKGKAFCFSESMSVYRLSEAGTWSTLSQINKNYKTLIIQLWIIRNFPLLLLKQARRIDSLFRSTYKEKKLFSNAFTFKEKLTILIVLVFYKLYIKASILKNRLLPK